MVIISWCRANGKGRGKGRGRESQDRRERGDRRGRERDRDQEERRNEDNFYAIYDYALSQQDVEILYDNKMVKVFENQ